MGLPSLVMLLGIAIGSAAEMSTTRDIADFVGADLRALSEVELRPFTDAYARSTGLVFERKHGFELWRLLAFVSDRTAALLVEVYPGYDIPDVSGVHVRRFDRNWRLLGMQAFPTGYRMFVKEVSVERKNDVQQPLLAIHAVASAYAGLDDKQLSAVKDEYRLTFFFGLMREELTLVRVEDKSGRIERNSYDWSMPDLGPQVPQMETREWISSLSSDNELEVLRTLVWLTGLHLPSSEPRREMVSQEPLALSRKFESLIHSRDVLEKLQQLRNHRCRWVQQYASLALRLIREGA